MSNQPSVRELLQAASSLNDRTLDTFVSRILALRAKRQVSRKPDKEVRLLKKINVGLSELQQNRFHFLKQKRSAETGISPAEEAELFALIEKIETLNVLRVKYIGQLSKIRNVSPKDLIHELGLAPKE